MTSLGMADTETGSRIVADRNPIIANALFDLVGIVRAGPRHVTLRTCLLIKYLLVIIAERELVICRKIPFSISRGMLTCFGTTPKILVLL